MSKSNDQRLQEIAAGMQSLNERLVYLGGALAGSYAIISVGYRVNSIRATQFRR